MKLRNTISKGYHNHVTASRNIVSHRMSILNGSKLQDNTSIHINRYVLYMCFRVNMVISIIKFTYTNNIYIMYKLQDI